MLRLLSICVYHKTSFVTFAGIAEVDVVKLQKKRIQIRALSVGDIGVKLKKYEYKMGFEINRV